MSSIAEGLYTIQINTVKQKLEEGQKNKKRWDAQCYNDISRYDYGPFTTDVIEWRIRAFPIGEELKLYLHVINDNGAEIKKYGFVNLQQNHREEGRWYTGKNTKLGHERVFEKDEFAKKMDRTIVPLNKLDRHALKNVTKNDTIVIKMAIWFVLYSSWKPSWNVCNGKSEDIHFVVQGMTFPAHGAVLAARSSKFKSELGRLQNYKPNDSRRLRLTIEDIKSLTLKYLLHFIYTDSLHPEFKKNNKEECRRLFRAAAHFKMQKLEEVCKKYLSRDDVDGAISIVQAKKLYEVKKI